MLVFLAAFIGNFRSVFRTLSKIYDESMMNSELPFWLKVPS